MWNLCQIFNKNLIQQLIQWYIQQMQSWHILTEWSILGKTRTCMQRFLELFMRKTKSNSNSSCITGHHCLRQFSESQPVVHKTKIMVQMISHQLLWRLKLHKHWRGTQTSRYQLPSCKTVEVVKSELPNQVLLLWVTAESPNPPKSNKYVWICVRPKQSQVKLNLIPGIRNAYYFTKSLHCQLKLYTYRNSTCKVTLSRVMY